MLLYVHFIVAFLVSTILVLLKWQWWQISLFFVAAFFIDVDHYFYFVYKKKSFNLMKAYNYFYNLNKFLKKERKKVELLMIFHTIEVFILTFILSIVFFNIFFPLFLGLTIHYFLDFLALLTHKEKRYKRVFSLIYYIIKNV
ncbi:MAG: hypothetical protein QXK80_02505 [Candidatus Pacearchaeota archaeon]